MVKSALVLLCAGLGACRSLPPTLPPPPPPLAFDLVACRSAPHDNICAGVPAPIFRLHTLVSDPDQYVTYMGDEAGYTYVTHFPNIPTSDLTILAEGYRPLLQGFRPADFVATNARGQHNFFPLEPLHVDPSHITLTELARIRGAMWTVRGPWAYGPRPFQPDNITALEFIYAYPLDVQAQMLARYKSFGYTHVAFGPINAQSYHGQYPDTNFESPEAFERWLDILQMFWDNGLTPICFLHPDNGSLDDTIRMYDHLIRYNARAQRLMRIIVPSGWEPTRYGWSSHTWAEYAKWGGDLLPNALILIHTVSDVDAPVGSDALGDDNGHSNAEGWARVTPYIHGWLVQSSAFENPMGHGDPNHPANTNFDNWAALFDRTVRGSYYDRFHNGYAGWPSTSLWGNRPIMVYAGEYCSYWEYWLNRPYDECVAWGDRAMAVGADGYLDSGSVVVP